MNITYELIKRHEGLRLKPYQCTEGKLTIGYGRNLEDNGITEQEADMLLAHDVLIAQSHAQTLSFFEALNDVRQAVIVNMIFNLGFPRFLGFKKMIAALIRGDFESAAREMLDSKWAMQVKGRAVELSEMMSTGAYHGIVQ